jgi:hypothetical protein
MNNEECTDKECPVCFGKVWLTKTSCNHLICVKCILELTENKCVYCRKKNIFNNLPFPIKSISKMFKKKNKKNINRPTNNVDINNLYDFPPLS